MSNIQKAKKPSLKDLLNPIGVLNISQKYARRQEITGDDFRKAIPPPALRMFTGQLQKLYGKVKELEQVRQEERGEPTLQVRMTIESNDIAECLQMRIMELWGAKGAREWTMLMVIPLNNDLEKMLIDSYATGDSFWEKIKEKYEIAE